MVRGFEEGLRDKKTLTPSVLDSDEVRSRTLLARQGALRVDVPRATIGPGDAKSWGKKPAIEANPCTERGLGAIALSAQADTDAGDEGRQRGGLPAGRGASTGLI